MPCSFDNPPSSTLWCTKLNKHCQTFFAFDILKFFTRREVVDALPLEVFMSRLDGPLSNLVWWKVSLAMAGG